MSIEGIEDGYEYEDAECGDECPYCGGICPKNEDNACDGWLGDIDGLADEDEDDHDDYDDYDDSMDGDFDSGMTSAGWGTDEDYGYYGGEDY